MIKGSHHSPESLRKISLSKTGKHPVILNPVDRSGANSRNWKGGITKQEGYKRRYDRAWRLRTGKTKYVIFSRCSIKKFTKVGNREYPPEWSDVRKKIYERDLWTCQECGTHCRSEKKTRIQCHHIDYNIHNNSYENLITLCASCHAKTNFDKDFWIYYFKNIKWSKN